MPLGVAQVVNQIYRNNTNGSATTVTCSLNPVAKFDVIYVAIGGDKSITSVADTHNTYTSQVSTSLTNNTVGAFAYLYSATEGTAFQAETVTVTFSASAHGSVICYDTAGFGATIVHSSTGTGGWSSHSASYKPSVTVYTPSLGNLEISVASAMACTSVGSPTFPTVTPPLANTNYGAQGNNGSPLVNTGTSCGTPGNYQNFLGVSYVLSSLGLATTDQWTVTSSQPTANTANFVEVAGDFAAGTVNSKTLTETVGLAAKNALANPSLFEGSTVSIVWSSNFETGDFSQWNGALNQNPAGTHVNITSAKSHSGLYSNYDYYHGGALGAGVKVNGYYFEYFTNTGTVSGTTTGPSNFKVDFWAYVPSTENGVALSFPSGSFFSFLSAWTDQGSWQNGFPITVDGVSSGGPYAELRQIALNVQPLWSSVGGPGGSSTTSGNGVATVYSTVTWPLDSWFEITLYGNMNPSGTSTLSVLQNGVQIITWSGNVGTIGVSGPVTYNALASIHAGIYMGGGGMGTAAVYNDDFQVYSLTGSPSGIGLMALVQLAQRANREFEGLFSVQQLAQRVNTEQECLGIKVNLTKGVYVVNTGAVCGTTVVAGQVLIAPCTFVQLQCWAIPLMYLGMIDGFFIGVAGAFRVSEKSWLYLTFAGLTWGSMVEISLGIMTPMLPIMLIVLNIAASFRLDKVITSSFGGKRNAS